jgi:hypothetical protein
LPAASCISHAALTSDLEREVARDTYGIHRAYEGMPSRRKGRHRTTLSSKTTVEGIELSGNKVFAEIPVSDQPRVPMLVRLQPPGVFRGGSKSNDNGVTLECKPVENDPAFARLRERLGWSQISIASPAVRPRSFLRVLAKISHAFASS